MTMLYAIYEMHSGHPKSCVCSLINYACSCHADAKNCK